ncbi:MAG TPA: hypothetical protein VFV83_08270 [Chthoniobacteraceae bacterium]|nr:hypothetical protein [Chthoniobacteraceae bacterium]
MPRSNRVTEQRGDYIAEELATILSEPVWIEFKPLFDRLYANLHRRGISQEEEALRLGAYDKLRSFVHAGAVEKSGKQYRGNPAALTNSLKHVAAQHCRELLDAVRCAERGGPSRKLSRS